MVPTVPGVICPPALNQALSGVLSRATTSQGNDIVLGAIYAVIYYALFRFLIRTLNIPIMGREPEEEEPERATSAAGAPVPA